MSHNEHYTYKANGQHCPLTVAACRSLCLVRLRPEVDALSLLAGSHVSRAGLVERQLLCNGSEEFANVLARLGGCLKEEKAGFAGVLLSVGGGDGALVRRLGNQIELVTGESDNDVLVGLALKLLDPRFRLVERGLCGVSTSPYDMPRVMYTACVIS
jgi:hypothetical protein